MQKNLKFQINILESTRVYLTTYYLFFFCKKKMQQKRKNKFENPSHSRNIYLISSLYMLPQHNIHKNSHVLNSPAKIVSLCWGNIHKTCFHLFIFFLFSWTIAIVQIEFIIRSLKDLFFPFQQYLVNYRLIVLSIYFCDFFLNIK